MDVLHKHLNVSLCTLELIEYKDTCMQVIRMLFNIITLCTFSIHGTFEGEKIKIIMVKPTSLF